MYGTKLGICSVGLHGQVLNCLVQAHSRRYDLSAALPTHTSPLIIQYLNNQGSQGFWISHAPCLNKFLVRTLEIPYHDNTIPIPNPTLLPISQSMIHTSNFICLSCLLWLLLPDCICVCVWCWTALSAEVWSAVAPPCGIRISMATNSSLVSDLANSHSSMSLHASDEAHYADILIAMCNSDSSKKN